MNGTTEILLTVLVSDVLREQPPFSPYPTAVPRLCPTTFLFTPYEPIHSHPKVPLGAQSTFFLPPILDLCFFPVCTLLRSCRNLGGGQAGPFPSH